MGDKLAQTETEKLKNMLKEHLGDLDQTLKEIEQAENELTFHLAKGYNINDMIGVEEFSFKKSSIETSIKWKNQKLDALIANIELIQQRLSDEASVLHQEKLNER